MVTHIKNVDNTNHAVGIVNDEIFLTEGTITSSLGAGERYDEMIGGFLQNGQEYPAVGISFGLDVICAALNMKEDDQYTSNIDIYIIPLETEKEALKIAIDMRKQGVKVDIDMTKRRLKKSLEYANQKRIPYVLILGENEIKSQILKMKNMNTGIEKEIRLEEMGRIFSSKIKK